MKKYNPRKMSPARANKLYESYSKRYDKLNNELFNKGLPLMSGKKTQIEFIEDYKTLDTANKADVAAGLAKRDKNIIRTMLNKDAYSFNPTEARTIKQQFGLKESITAIRTGYVKIQLNGNDVLLSEIVGNKKLYKALNDKLWQYAQNIQDYTPWGITYTGKIGAEIFMTKVLHGSP